MSGLSTARLLQDHGWDISIITEADPRTASPDPTFASLVPAASIIPHSVYSSELTGIFSTSKDYFQKLRLEHFPGVQLNQHYELFAQETSLPEYAQLMDHFESLEAFRHSFHPTHPEIEIQAGWRFNCYFTDWSIYYPALLEEVLNNGAKLLTQSLNHEDLSKLPFDIIINCSEMGSIDLFEDPHGLLYRGHVIQVPGAPKLTDPEGNLISYNFSPGSEIYQTKTGTSQDVYLYPRSDGWILGGSRQKGTIDEKGKWTGDESIPPQQTLDGFYIPAQIYQLNSGIIRHTFGVNTDQFSELKGRMAYRYVRKQENGLRLEAEQMHDKLFIHNYGHGGAGVTLSWGCAKKVVDILDIELS